LGAQTHEPCEFKPVLISKNSMVYNCTKHNEYREGNILLGYLAQLSQGWSIKVIAYTNYL